MVWGVRVHVEFGDEVFEGMEVVVFDGEIEGLDIVLVVDEGFYAELGEEFDHFDIAVFSGDEEWGYVELIRDIGVYFELSDEVLGDFDVAFFGGVVDGVIAVAAFDMWVGA